MSGQDQFVMRDQLRATDEQAVREILSSSGFFYEEEVAVAQELVRERLARGAESGYHFLFAEPPPQGGGAPQPLGFACFGPIALTAGSYDLFWIAVHGKTRHGGLGSRLLAQCEQRAAAMGACRLYIETSSRPLYEPTRAFYLKRGYRLEATLADFYGPGDGKVIFVKALGGSP